LCFNANTTKKQIFVEKQRAELTLDLALMKEKEGKVVEAATILQEVQVGFSPLGVILRSTLPK
jgi:hypothetical protein